MVSAIERFHCTNMFVIIEYVTLWKIMENEIFFLILGADLIKKHVHQILVLEKFLRSVFTKWGNFCSILRKITFYEIGQLQLQTGTAITKQGNFIAKDGSYYKTWGAFFSKFCVLDCMNSFKWPLISPLSFPNNNNNNKKQVESKYTNIQCLWTLCTLLNVELIFWIKKGFKNSFSITTSLLFHITMVISY